MRKLNKGRRVLKVVLIAILLFLCAFVIFQLQNIKALLDSKLYSQEELEQKIETSKTDLGEKLEEYIDTPLTDLTIEQEKGLLNGQLTYEEAIKIINANQDENAASSSTSEQTANEAAIAAAVKANVGKLYALKAAYLANLGRLEKQAYTEFLALPPSEQNTTNKTKILAGKLEDAAAYESQCDASVDKILNNLSSELKTYNGDMKIISILKDAYEDEKVLKKSYYLSLME